MKKKISMKTQMFWRHIAPGILWILFSVVGIIAPDIVIVPFIVLGVALLLAIIFSAYKGEAEDEMAQENYTKAKASANRAMHHFLGAAAVVSAIVFGLLKDCGLSWHSIVPRLLFAIMGVQDILVGLFFYKWETE